MPARSCDRDGPLPTVASADPEFIRQRVASMAGRMFTQARLWSADIGPFLRLPSGLGRCYITVDQDSPASYARDPLTLRRVPVDRAAEEPHPHASPGTTLAASDWRDDHRWGQWRIAWVGKRLFWIWQCASIWPCAR